MQSISPETIYRGNDAWERALPQIANLTKSPLILGRSVHTKDIKYKIFRDLKKVNLMLIRLIYNLTVAMKIFQKLRKSS